MSNTLSEECKKRLRDIDKGLEQVLSRRTAKGCLKVFEQILNASEVDDGCRELLRSIEREMQNIVERTEVLEDDTLPESLLEKLRNLQSTVAQHNARSKAASKRRLVRRAG